MISYIHIAPGQGLTAWGQNLDVNRNIIYSKFKKNPFDLKSEFIQFFHDFIHVYSPGAGAAEMGSVTLESN